MYEKQIYGFNPNLNTPAPSCPEAHIMPAQVSPIQYIVKKNTIVHVIPHFHPPQACDTNNGPAQPTPLEPMRMYPHCCHPPQRRPLMFRGRRF